MKGTKMLTILVLALGLMVWQAPMVYAAQYLTVNGQDVTSITLELGQSRTVEVVSDDSNPYNAYVGFDDGVALGDFSHLQTMSAAGDLANVTEYNLPAFYGYYVEAAGVSPSPSPGVHFVFEYVAQELGTTDVKLYNSTFKRVIDSVHITVIPLQPVAMGTAFTYQGRLLDANDVADGLYDLQFKLYDNTDPVFAAQQGSTIDINDLDVIDGYFTVELDFGSGIFDGDGRWLQIGVRPGDSTDPNAFVTLSPRTELTPTPYAIYAQEAAYAQGATDLALPYSGTVSSGAAAFSMTNTGTGYAGDFGQTGSSNTNGGLNVTTAAGQYGAKILNQGGYSGTSYGMWSRVFGSDGGDSYGIYSEGRKYSSDTDGTAYGGYFIGDNDRTGGESYGLYTKAMGLNGNRYGLYSQVTTSSGIYNNFGLYAKVANSNSWSFGLYADLDPGKGGYGVYVNLDTTTSSTNSQYGLYSNVNHQGTSGTVYGVQSITYSSNSGVNYAGYFRANSSSGDTGPLHGIYAYCDNDTSGPKYAGYFYKSGGGNYAGYFDGNVHISGTLTKSSGSFKIDHPLDPENKYLSHSFVESPDMMNVYNGNAALDENGEACVQLPEYFESLNRDFRYQLTCIGGFAPVYVSEEISENRFKIAGGKRGMKVSWQVTGVRHDPYAVAHRVQVEEEKNNEERGYYLNPMAYGLPEEKGIESVRNPRVSETRQVAKR